MADIKYRSYVDDYSFKRRGGIKHSYDGIKLRRDDIKVSGSRDEEDYEDVGWHPNSARRKTWNKKENMDQTENEYNIDMAWSRVGKEFDVTQTLTPADAMGIREAGSEEESASSFFGAQNSFGDGSDDVSISSENVSKKGKRKKNGRYGYIKEGFRYIGEINGLGKGVEDSTEHSNGFLRPSKGSISENIGKELNGLKKASVALLPFALLAGAVLSVFIMIIASVSMLMNVLSISGSNLSESEQAIWQYLKEEGFSDYAIAGIMGCYGSESGHDPNTVEGEYVQGFPGREAIMSDMDGYCRRYLFPYYDRTGVGYSKRGYLYNGQYYPGLGLAQWTGVRAWRLLHYDMGSHTVSSDYNNMQWNDLTVQLDYMIHFEQSDRFWNEYKNIVPKGNESDEDCVRRATEVFFSTVEMPGNHETKFLGQRKENAVEAFNKSRAFGGNGAFIWPCPDSHRITSGFGGRNSPGGIGSTDHKGIDIGASTGTDVVAAASGTVIYTGYNSSRGNFIKIDHGNGYVTIYQHLSGFNCGKGDMVYAGDVIGYVGSTGHSTGPHLHFEIVVEGVPVDPMGYLE